MRKILVDWETPIVAARTRVTPDHVLRVLQHYRAADGLLGRGALHRRLCRAHEDIPPTQGWPAVRAPSSGCQRAMDRLAAVRQHLAERGTELEPDVFAAKFAADMSKIGLEKYAPEALFRESMQEAAYQ